MARNGTVVDCAGVTKVYRQGTQEVHALRGLTLEIATGEFTAICGPSGSGKTTLLNLIGALDRPTAGTIHLEGRNLGAMSQRERSHLRRDRIGFVFQAYNLMPVLTAYENAEMVLALQGVGVEERHDRVERILTEVGLEGLSQRRPDELSGGQQQRVAIARAIASNPAVVLADEPTAKRPARDGARPPNRARRRRPRRERRPSRLRESSRLRDLRDKVVVVTGAASGIGNALARGLCAKGAHLALVDIDESRLTEITHELEGSGQRVSSHVADVGDRRRMQSLPYEVVAEHGCVDVLINNAGVSVGAMFADHSIDDAE
jgi:putative ABC transport system ATP-binding protein